MLLRSGNADSNTSTDHEEVLVAAIRQVPAGTWKPGSAEDGSAEEDEDKDVAEITGLMSCAGNLAPPPPQDKIHNRTSNDL
jgi:hypothetical protein